jgi:hypothetical protein
MSGAPGVRGAPCKVCNSPNKLDIETALIEGIPERTIMVRFGVHHDAVRRHKQHHMAADILEAYRVQRRLTEVMDVPDKMHAEWALLEELLDRTLEPLGTMPPTEAMMMIDKQFLGRLLGLRHKYFVTMLQVLGEMPESTVLNIMVGTQWAAMLKKLDDRIGDDEELRKRLSAILAPDIRGEYRVLDGGDNNE